MSNTSSKESKEEQNASSTTINEEVEALKKTLKAEQEKANDYLNRLKYLQADFENYKKRIGKEMNEIQNYGSQNLVLELLPIIDELECAVEAGKNCNDKEAITKGVEMTLKKICENLGRQGLTTIDAEGKPFDPSKHNAIERVTTKDYKEGIIIEEIRRGYMFKGRVVRPSLVKVAVQPIKNNSMKGDDD